MAMSMQIRKRIEQNLGSTKAIGDLRKLPVISLAHMRGWETWSFAAYSFVCFGGSLNGEAFSQGSTDYLWSCVR
jgi:hypothetical protein